MAVSKSWTHVKPLLPESPDTTYLQRQMRNLATLSKVLSEGQKVMNDTVALDVKNLNLDLGGETCSNKYQPLSPPKNFLVLSALMVEAKPLFSVNLLASSSQQKGTPYLGKTLPDRNNL